MGLVGRVVLILAIVTAIGASFYLGTVYKQAEVDTKQATIDSLNGENSRLKNIMSNYKSYYDEYQGAVTKYNELVDRVNAYIGSQQIQKMRVYCTSSVIGQTTFTNCY